MVIMICSLLQRRLCHAVILLPASWHGFVVPSVAYVLARPMLQKNISEERGFRLDVEIYLPVTSS